MKSSAEWNNQFYLLLKFFNLRFKICFLARYIPVLNCQIYLLTPGYSILGFRLGNFEFEMLKLFVFHSHLCKCHSTSSHTISENNRNPRVCIQIYNWLNFHQNSFDHIKTFTLPLHLITTQFAAHSSRSESTFSGPVGTPIFTRHFKVKTVKIQFIKILFLYYRL